MNNENLEYKQEQDYNQGKFQLSFSPNISPNKHNWSLSSSNRSSTQRMNANRSRNTATHTQNNSNMNTSHTSNNTTKNVIPSGFPRVSMMTSMDNHSYYYQKQSKSMMSQHQNEHIFHDCVPIIIKSSQMECRTKELTLKIEKIIKNGQNGEILAISLTDESDPFFLFTLEVSESDFHELRSEQSLLIDFQAFPKSLVFLLQQCLQCRNDEHPKFVAVLNHRSNGNGNHFTFLSVQETNKFRHLQHISLRLRTGNDLLLREYLGKTLMQFKQSNIMLEQEMNSVRNELKYALKAKMESEEYVNELKHKTEQAICDLKTAHAQQTSDLMQQSLETQEEIRKKGIHAQLNIKKELELKIKAIELKFNETKDLFENTHHTKILVENELKILKKQFLQISNEYEFQSKEISELRMVNKTLDELKYKNEKTINQQMIQMSALQQQIKDKQEIYDNYHALLRAEKIQNKSLDDSLQMYKSNLDKNEKKMHECVREINKGNDIIIVLQNKIRDGLNKNKIKDQKLNVLMQKCSVQMEDMEKTKMQLKTKDSLYNKTRNDIKELKQTLRECREKLEQSQKAIQSNQRIITYLNTQLNEKQMKGNIFSMSSPMKTYDFGAGNGGKIGNISSNILQPYSYLSTSAAMMANKMGSGILNSNLNSSGSGLYAVKPSSVMPAYVMNDSANGNIHGSNVALPVAQNMRQKNRNIGGNGIVSGLSAVHVSQKVLQPQMQMNQNSPSSYFPH